MKTVVYSIVVVTGLMINPTLSYAQQGERDHINQMIPKPAPASPNAASLGKFGDYQISHFTGLPDISIPIYEVQSGALKVPITLSYHASGIKPTDVASWVGAGWALSAGGQISQNVRGKNDNEHYLTHAINPFPTTCGNFYYLQRAARQVIDTEPDIFSYSYPGGRGKFLLPNGATFVSENQTHPNEGAFLVPYAPILVNRVNDTRFEITDEHGILYRYGTSPITESSLELTTGYSGGVPTPSAYTFNLLEVKSPNSNDDITFRYQPVGSANTSDIFYTYVIKDECENNEFITCPTPYNLFAQKSPIDSRTNQQGLSEILFENGKVKFTLGSLRSDAQELKYLDKIEIYSVLNGSETKIKTIQFLYSYFTDANSQAASLKLDAVHMLDNGNISVQKYKFQYFTNSFSWNRNHINFLNARDLWGYYNGATQNTDLLLPQTVPYQPVPTITTTLSFGGAVDRTAKEQFLKEGVLKRIDFPTGGYTEFEFESNKYFDGSIKNAGGLRIAKIKSSAGTPTGPVTKTYRYGLNESSYGLANFNSKEFNYISNARSHQFECHVGSPFLKFRMRAFYSNSAFSLDGFDTSPVMYPYVTEYNGDTEGVTLGKTIYVFDEGSPAIDTYLEVPNTTKVFRQSFFWKRGKLTRKTVFDNAAHKLTETTHTYTMHHQTVDKLVGLGVVTFQVGPELPCPSENGTCANEIGEKVWPDNFFSRAYYLTSGAWLQTGTGERIFQSDNELLSVSRGTSVTYHPDKLQVLESKSSLINQDEQSVTVNTYPFQLTAANASSTGNAQGVYMLKNKNMLSTPLETYTYLQRSDYTNQRIVSGQVNTFKQNPNNTNYVVPDKVFILSLPARLSKSSYSAIGINGGNSDIVKHSNYQERVTFGSFDNLGNIQSVSRTNEPILSYKWGYNNALPVAEVTNALPKDVFYNSFEEATSNFWWEAKAGKKGSVGTISYSQAIPGLTPGPYILSYHKKVAGEWQYNETPVTVPASGIYPINLGIGQFDEIRLYPTSAQVKTYTHEPGIGMTSTMDTNGVATYYEYDSFGRLKMVRDNESDVVKAYDYHYKLQP